MQRKKIVEEYYEDPETGMKFIRDVWGNIHPYFDLKTDTRVVIDTSEKDKSDNEKLRRILNRIRVENNWLFSIIEGTIKQGKKGTARKALDALEKALKERTRHDK